MPHGHAVDNCILRFCRKGRQLDLGESRFPTQIFQRNQLAGSRLFRAYVCAFGPGLLVMIAMVMMDMVMMTMVMVLVMVIIVLEALRQVGWLHQHQHQASIDWEPSVRQSVHELRVFHRRKDSRGKLYSSRSRALWSMALSSTALSRTALSSRLSSGLSCRLSSRLSSSLSSRLPRGSGHSSGIAATTAGSKARYWSISGRQPYIVPLAHAYISMNRL